jgi:transcriptional regulator with XRE-family HTH domain
MSRQQVTTPAERPLRAWRIGEGKRLEDVADALGCSVATLSRIETGITKRLDPRLVDRITKLTGLTYGQLV